MNFNDLLTTKQIQELTSISNTSSFAGVNKVLLHQYLNFPNTLHNIQELKEAKNELSLYYLNEVIKNDNVEELIKHYMSSAISFQQLQLNEKYFIIELQVIEIIPNTPSVKAELTYNEIINISSDLSRIQLSNNIWITHQQSENKSIQYAFFKTKNEAIEFITTVNTAMPSEYVFKLENLM